MRRALEEDEKNLIIYLFAAAGGEPN